MSELRIGRPGDQPHHPPGSPEEQRSRGSGERPAASAPAGGHALGAEELAIALGQPATVQARLEYDPDGRPLARVIDRRHGETVALLTLAELQELTEATGLPPGMFIRAET